MTRDGNFTIQSNAILTNSASNLATVNGIVLTNPDVQANVTLDASGSFQFAGVVARYTGNGVANMYFAGLLRNGSTTSAQIYVNRNGTWTLLSSQNVGAITGIVRLEVVNNSLKLFFNDGLVGSVIDSTLSTAGAVGIYASQGSTIDTFSVSPLVN